MPVSASAAASLALLAVSGCDYSPRRTVNAIPLEMHGTVSVQSDRNSPEIPLDGNATLAVGAIVRTESASDASIALLPNALVRLTENTKLEILSLSLAKDGNETEDPMLDRSAHVKLWRGAIFLSHQRRGTARAELRITTSQGEATTGSLAIGKLEAGNHHVRLTSVSGQIVFLPREGNKAEQIPPGNVAEWNSGVPSLAPAATDRLGQEDSQQALEADRELRALLLQKRNVLPR